jgi:hypothetical protein
MHHFMGTLVDKVLELVDHYHPRMRLANQGLKSPGLFIFGSSFWIRHAQSGKHHASQALNGRSTRYGGKENWHFETITLADRWVLIVKGREDTGLSGTGLTHDRDTFGLTFCVRISKALLKLHLCLHEGDMRHYKLFDDCRLSVHP